MTTPHANIVLIGLRASGKTTIGERLSRGLARPFEDLDHITRALFAEPGSISEIWRRFGESRWRGAEAIAIEHVLQTPAQVIALGGGTATIASVRNLILQGRQDGSIVPVYLQCRAEVLQARLRQEQGGEGGDRPPLLGKNAVDEVCEVLAAREPLYLQLASITVNADEPVDAVVNLLVASLRQFNIAPPDPA